MHTRELPIPSVAGGDSNAVELLRVWAAQGKQHVALATRVWDDPAAWGIMLVDLAKHIASAYQQTEGKDYGDVLSRVREGFDAEWETATDEPSGSVP
jgi:hypothetical protein